MVSLKSVRKLEKFISKLALSLKRHFRTSTGVYLFATFLEMLATYKLVGKVIARQRAIIARRIRANQATESLERSRSNTARLGTQNQFLEARGAGATSLSSENGWKKINKKLFKKHKMFLWEQVFYIFWPPKNNGFLLKCRHTTRKKYWRNKRRISKDCPYARGSRRSWIRSPLLLPAIVWSTSSSIHVATVARVIFHRYSQFHMVSNLWRLESGTTSCTPSVKHARVLQVSEVSLSIPPCLRVPLDTTVVFQFGRQRSC